MNQTTPHNENSAVFWTTLLAQSVQAVVCFSAVASWLAIPRFIRIFEDLDANLPPLTMIFVRTYDACGPLWFVLPAALFVLYVAGGWIFYRLFRNPESRSLAVILFFAELLVVMIFGGLTVIAMIAPLFALMSQLS